MNAMRAGRTLFGKKIADSDDLFDAIDRDGSGVIDLDEFAAALHRMDVRRAQVEVRTSTLPALRRGPARSLGGNHSSEPASQPASARCYAVLPLLAARARRRRASRLTRAVPRDPARRLL